MHRLLRPLVGAFFIAVPGVASAASLTFTTQDCSIQPPSPLFSPGDTGSIAIDVYGRMCVSGVSGGGGGGGETGPVTIADGADTVQGSINDAATTVGGAGTMSAKLRAVTTQLNTLSAQMTTLTTLFNNASAPLPVHVTFPATQPVSLTFPPTQTVAGSVAIVPLQSTPNNCSGTISDTDANGVHMIISLDSDIHGFQIANLAVEAIGYSELTSTPVVGAAGTWQLNPSEKYVSPPHYAPNTSIYVVGKTGDAWTCSWW